MITYKQGQITLRSEYIMTNYKVIVKEDRTIIFPDRDKIDIMAVQYDHNVTTLNFECPSNKRCIKKGELI